MNFYQKTKLVLVLVCAMGVQSALFTNSIFSGIKYLNLAGFPIRKDTPEQGLQLLETVQETAHGSCYDRPAV